MFCHECGSSARGKFCSQCGTPLCAEDPDVWNGPLEPVADWETEVQYDRIIAFPGVREQVEREARQSRKRLSGEEFLKLADKLVPLGVSLEGIAAVAQPLYARLGIKTGKQRVRQVPAPVARVLVRVLCSLARHGQSLRSVTQAADGCLIEASLPSDMFALEGDLYVSLRRNGLCTDVDAATRIPGQVFDWGKSHRCLEKLLADAERNVAA